MLDYFAVTVQFYGHDIETLIMTNSNEASAIEDARFHYNSDLRNQLIDCTMIACGWAPDAPAFH